MFKWIVIQLNIKHLFTHSEMIKQFYFKQSNLAYVNKVKNDSKYCYLSLTIQLNISHLFTHT